MVFIYTLKLEQGKYYIGKTNNPKFRLNNHFNSNGSEWTKKFKPIRLLSLKSNCDDYDEDKITKQCMDKYGINNVRGGSFVSIKLNNSILQALIQMSNGTNNKCFICGREGHFAKYCEEDEDLETDSDEEYEYWSCEYCKRDFDTKKGCLLHENVYCSKKNKKQFINKKNSSSMNNGCFRCGREGHFVSSCYASKHIKGYYLN
jgi:hypothetical protein